jgi:hypothetical protein
MNNVFSKSVIIVILGIAMSLTIANAVADEKGAEQAKVLVDTGTVYWQTNAGGCVPSDDTMKRAKRFTVTATGRVMYAKSTAPLVFSCPVHSINPNVAVGNTTVIRLFYKDPDGAGEDFKVEATLRSYAKSNGELKEVCKVASDKAGSWQEAIGVCSKIDMNANIYWVEVVVKHVRTDSSVVEFNGVSLESRTF